MNRRLIGLIAGLGISLSATTHAQQNAWDAVGDFNLNANPNGAWSYSWQAAGGGPLMPMAFAGSTCGSSGVICWTRFDGDPLPQVGINSTTSPIEYGSGLVPLNVLTLHPAVGGERPVVTWTAPHTSGRVKYIAAGQFQLVDWDNIVYGLGGVKVIVSIDDTEVFSDTLTKFGQTKSFNVARSLKPGQKISFAVDANNNNANDLTVLRVGILRDRP